MTEQIAPQQIDLRGIYRPPGTEGFNVERPEDLVRFGIRVPEHAILATPTWGEEALEDYRRAIETVESNVIFDFEKAIEG